MERKISGEGEAAGIEGGCLAYEFNSIRKFLREGLKTLHVTALSLDDREEIGCVQLTS